MPVKANNLTPLGKLINQTGLALPFVIEKSGILRSRLVYLRTSPSAVLSLWEAYALAPIFQMTLDQFAEELKRIEEEGEKSRRNGSPWGQVLVRDERVVCDASLRGIRAGFQ